MAQNLRKHHVFICAKKKVFSIFNKRKVTAEKQRFQPFLVFFFRKFTNEQLCKKHSRLILICEINSTRITNTVSDLMHE